MNRIRAVFCVAAALAMTSATAFASVEDEAALRHIKEVDWPKAYREQNPELLDRILADEFQMIDADGASSSKREELEYVRKNKPSYDGFRFQIKRLEVFENDCAVVGGTGRITERRGASEVVTEYQSTNVFIKRDGRWQAIASHVSGVKERSAADRPEPSED
jgi:hypothetical protein